LLLSDNLVANLKIKEVYELKLTKDNSGSNQIWIISFFAVTKFDFPRLLDHIFEKPSIIITESLFN